MSLDDRVIQLLARLGVPSIPFVPAAGYTALDGRVTRLIVLHDMEYPERPDGAEWCLGYFARGAVRASCHYAVDSDSIGQGVHLKDVAWAAPGANHDGVQIEQAGYAAQSRDEWLDDYSRAEMSNTAKLVAALCVALDIPPQHLTDAEISAGAAGIVDHVAVNRVYHRSDHADCGPNYPWDALMPLVSGHVATLAGALTPVVTPPPAPVPSVAIPPFPGTVRLGSRGTAVRAVQQRLKDRGWRIVVDGTFGPQTDSIVRAYQREKRLTVDGIVGPITWRSLWTAPVTR